MNKLLPFVLFLLSSFHLFATHNRSGEITYIQTDDLTIEATITTFTKASSVPADRDSLTLCWGDGNCEFAYRINGTNQNGEILENDFKRNKYVISHTYSDLGDYILSMTDPNRNAGILNINSGFSDQIPFYLETEFTLSSELNNSPVILQEPIDIAFLGESYIHVLNAFDVDGDSVSYRLVSPLIASGEEVFNYMEVTEIGAGDENILSFDETIGLLDWSTPQVEGEYNIAFEILTYRDGILNSRTVRDMQILVLEMPNLLCEISTNFGSNEDLINVSVGEIINMEITAMDSDAEQVLMLSSTSGLYDFFSSAPSFDIINQNENIVNAVFNWEVQQEHVRAQPYQVIFKANDEFGLANYAVRQFKVLGFLDDTDNPLVGEELVVFPNPSSDILTIRMGENAYQSNEYTIWDLTGRMVQSGTVQNATESQINIVSLAEGVYLLKFDETFVGKIVKER